LPSDFFDKVDELKDHVGDKLEGKVIVDQIYAHYQHEDLALEHPHGGEAKYLEKPLFEHFPSYMQNIAETTLGEEGPKEGMIKSMEHLSEQVFLHAPVLYGDLKGSANPTVKQGSETVYDRKAAVDRKTQAQLEEQRDIMTGEKRQRTSPLHRKHKHGMPSTPNVPSTPSVPSVPSSPTAPTAPSGGVTYNPPPQQQKQPKPPKPPKPIPPPKKAPGA